MQGHTEKIEAIDLEAKPAVQPARYLGKYEIHEKIGEGGFGVVYKGFDPFIKRFVAVKTCNSPDKSIRDRYFREAEIAGRLDHPNIVRIFDFGVEDETPFLVQEFLGGTDLDHTIASSEFVPYPERLLYLIQIARGLDCAHSQGVIHRDIKPANIRILEDGSVKIMDFGVAMLQYSDHRLTEAGMTVGTAAYLAPEQIEGRAGDARTDIFSFGILAYELLSGQRPFDQDNISATLYSILHDDPGPLSIPESICPAPLTQLILDCLEKRPEGRPADFSTVLSRLEAVRRDMKSRTGERDYTSELRRTAPRSAATAEARSQQFDPPLQQEWTPQSIRVGIAKPRRRGWIVAAILTISAGGLAWAVGQGLIRLPATENPIQTEGQAPQPTIEPAGSTTSSPPESLADTSTQGAEPGFSDSATTEAADDNLDPTVTASTSKEAVVTEPEPEQSEPPPPPVPEDATVHLSQSWHDQATVSIDGAEAIRLSSSRTHRLEPGEHKLAYALVTPEYRVFNTIRVSLEPGEERRIRTPIPRPGLLTVQANLGSPQGVIHVGKRALGSTPLRGLQLAPGRHVVKIASQIDPELPLSEATVDIKSSRETVVTFDLTGRRDLAVRYNDLDP